MHSGENPFPRLDCPAPNHERYKYLRSGPSKTRSSTVQLKYFFALNLHQCVNKLPQLLGSVVEAIRLLGPEQCALSIVEGRSDDGTYEVLDSLQKEIEGIGAKYFFNSSDLDPTAGERIAVLAELRNQALEPLTSHPHQYSNDSTVIFINDVSLCMEDILELVHQRVYQGADMTCPLDWAWVGVDPTFYDVWIARGMTGDTFFDIPEDGNYNSAWNIFWNDPKAHEAYVNHKSFQVFSCWNGATAFTAKPLLDETIKFRKNHKNECYTGEPHLFCKDMWFHGYGKIAVVPSVNIEYSDDGQQRIKAKKGFASQWVEGDRDKIEWQNPPQNVKCVMDGYARSTWVPWDEALA